tara:strand:+ start:5151 stop:5663 length:513 start_codon:yes stop_codon:yes gene_type:complete
MSTVTQCVSVNISRENNGVVKIDGITNITKMRISSIMFKHGARKKTKQRKSKKRRDDSLSEEEESKYENGNEDLMDAVYMDLLVNNFRRGSTYYYDGTVVEDGDYTARIPLDLEYDGTGDYYKTEGYDWELSPKEQPNTLEEVNIHIRTDVLSNPKCYDMLVELEFVTLI